MTLQLTETQFISLLEIKINIGYKQHVSHDLFQHQLSDNQQLVLNNVGRKLIQLSYSTSDVAVRISKKTFTHQES